MARADDAPQAERRVEALLSRGDALFLSKDDDRSTWTVIGLGREALKIAPRSFQAHYRVARAYARLADKARDRGDGENDHGRKGHYHAIQAIAAEPNRVEGHYWAAICIGEDGKQMGIMNAIAKGIRARFLGHLRAASRLDPHYEDGGASRMLAMYHHSLPVPFKDNAQGLREIRRAERQSPGHSRTLFCWAQILWDEGLHDEARGKARACIKSDKGGDPLTNRDFQARCRRLLDAWQG